MEGELEEQWREEELLEEQLQQEKERAEKEAARGWKLARALQQQTARAEPGWLRQMLRAQQKRQEAEHFHGSPSQGPRTIRSRIDPETGLRVVAWPNGRPTLRPLTSRVIRR